MHVSSHHHRPALCLDAAPAPTLEHRFGTLAIHAGSTHDPSTGAVIEPISLSTTFAQTAEGKPVGVFEYSHSANPNRTNFEAAVAALEYAHYALVYSSGSAATANILQSLAAGSHVAPTSSRSPTSTAAPTTTSLRSLRPTGLRSSRSPTATAFWSSLITPFCPCVSAFNSDDLLKTLHLRASEATHNATTVATAFEASPNVITVNYPGLDSHPHRAIAIKQHYSGMRGGILSFRIKGGHNAAELSYSLTKILTLAESLSGVESLVELTRSMAKAVVVLDDLVRISCGVKDADDLKNDVLQASRLPCLAPGNTYFTIISTKKIV
ncbi:cystathionine gamma-lyase [Cordyceps fumosorosea ARSEF 2679]|uniref:cystathionine gamma-lyase n=1 Tax=Cordyceps fumosorosea (strain ARSEF 2679) TaxID=1081104 RepID=A0A167AUF9_CORFA|nr:cystathionine gamma-lyase [Cordyceps fumosorosea ARSEF 2679]OAA39341.1 cystathionine gamma-lyase [Cordyceps fumosorosea ARSEF 2679]